MIQEMVETETRKEEYTIPLNLLKKFM